VIAFSERIAKSSEDFLLFFWSSEVETSAILRAMRGSALFSRCK